MPAQNEKQPSKIDVIAWALRQLADEMYVFETGQHLGGWELHIFESAENNSPLSLTQDQACKIEGDLVSALTEIFPNPEDRIAFIARMGVQKFIHRGRERLGGTEIASLERDLLASSANEGVVREAIASAYLKEFAGEFEKLVRRAKQLRVPDTSAPVPEQVHTYLAEATRCYVYGRFIACLLVCRSAVEFALRYFLVREGKQEELKQLQAEEKDGLRELIGLAQSLGKWRLKATLDDADEIRRKANTAVHFKTPDVNVSKDLFIKTRGVLCELYSGGVLRG